MLGYGGTDRTTTAFLFCSLVYGRQEQVTWVLLWRGPAVNEVELH